MLRIMFDGIVFLVKSFTSTDANDESNAIATPTAIPPDTLTKDMMLGSGSVGAVFRGKWNGKRVAIKELGYSADNIGKFFAEKSMMENLTNSQAPNMVMLYGYSPVDIANQYLVMEYMPKGTLASHFRSQPFEWSLRYRIFFDITIAVNYLHQIYVVHRDIKSLNVLLNENYEAKLGDFDRSTKIEQSDSRISSPPWLAPEIFMGKSFKEYSDVYSLCVTLWELAAWKMPYQNIRDEAVPERTKRSEREPIPADAPEKVKRIFARGTLFDPYQRPTTTEILNEGPMITVPETSSGTKRTNDNSNTQSNEPDSKRQRK